MILDEIFSSVFSISFAAAVVSLTVPIFLAACGELFNELSGNLNIGIEGIVTMGGFFSYFLARTGSLFEGIMGGLIAGAAFGLLFAFVAVSLKTNQTLGGFSVLFLGLGLSFLFYRFYLEGSKILPVQFLSVPILSQIPIIGPILFQQTIFTYIFLIVLPLSAFVLAKTNIGLNIRAIGENPEAADTAGINVSRYRYATAIFGGAMAGLAGAAITLGVSGSFTPDIAGGRGWVALVLVIFGEWQPLKIFAGSLLFGIVNAFGFRLQVLFPGMPYQFINLLPYLFTILALTLVSKRRRGPASLGIPYIKW